MGHPKDDEIYPVGTIVKLKSGKHAGKKARIDKQVFRMNGKGFMYYLGPIERPSNGPYALFHSELEVVSFPPKTNV